MLLRYNAILSRQNINYSYVCSSFMAEKKETTWHNQLNNETITDKMHTCLYKVICYVEQSSNIKTKIGFRGLSSTRIQRIAPTDLIGNNNVFNI